MKKDYKIIYGRLSAIEHTGPDSAWDYLYDSEKGKTQIKAGPRDKNIDLVLLTSLEYFFNAQAITHNIFGVDWPNLEKDRKEFLDLRIVVHEIWKLLEREGYEKDKLCGFACIYMCIV